MAMFQFDCGDVVRDKITGFKGVVIGRSQWLSNYNTYSVKPQTLKDGATLKSEGFDEPQLELVEAATLPKHQSTGGPERTPAPSESHA